MIETGFQSIHENLADHGLKKSALAGRRAPQRDGDDQTMTRLVIHKVSP
jgi:hypothetical protein